MELNKKDNSLGTQAKYYYETYKGRCVEPCYHHSFYKDELVGIGSMACCECEHNRGANNKEDYVKCNLHPFGKEKEQGIVKEISKEDETKGKHYDFVIDPYEYSFKNKLNPLQFNAIKYISRYPLKNGKQDLEKAIETIKRLIELEY